MSSSDSYSIQDAMGLASVIYGRINKCTQEDLNKFPKFVSLWMDIAAVLTSFARDQIILREKLRELEGRVAKYDDEEKNEKEEEDKEEKVKDDVGLEQELELLRLDRKQNPTTTARRAHSKTNRSKANNETKSTQVTSP
jgi:hypothetical protein